MSEVMPGKNYEIVIRSIISIGLIGASVTAALVMKFNAQSHTEKKKEVSHTCPSVEVAQVQSHTDGILFDTDGEVIHFRQISVSPEVLGRVVFKSPNCRSGHYVRKGEVLLRIDDRDYQIEVRRTEDQHKQTTANLAELDVQIANLATEIEIAKQQWAIQRGELARYESVKDPGVYSGSEIDAARRGELTARNSVQALINKKRVCESQKNRLELARSLAKTNWDKALLDLQRTEIVAPITGMITAHNVEEDCYVKKGDVAVTIQDTSCLEIRCSLRMEQLYWLWRSKETIIPIRSALAEPSVEQPPSETPAQAPNPFQLPDIPVRVAYTLEDTEYNWEGVLSCYDGGAVDRKTRMMPCRVLVCNPKDAEAICCPKGGEPYQLDSDKAAPPILLAGMFVKVEARTRPDMELLRVPEVAVLPGGMVWRVHENKLQQLNVRTATTTDNQVILYADQSGLAAGDLVVSSPMAAPAEGTEVKIIRTAPVPTRERVTRTEPQPLPKKKI